MLRAKAEAILCGENVRPPKSVGRFLELRAGLVGALVSLPVGRRIEATKNLLRYAVRHWRGEGSLRAIMVVERYGATAEFREIVREVIASDAWTAFAREYAGDISFLDG